MSVVATLFLGVVLTQGFVNWPGIGPFTFWALLSIIASLLLVRLPEGGATTSMGEIVDLAALATAGLLPVLVANVAGVLGRNAINRPTSLLRNIFNLSQWNAATITGYFVLKWLIPEGHLDFSPITLGAFFAAWLAFSTVSTILVSSAISLDEKRPIAPIWIHNYGRETLVSLFSVPLALIMALLYSTYGALPVVLLLLPILVTSFLTGLWVDRDRIRQQAERDKKLTEMGKASAAVLHELSKPISRIVMTSDYALTGGYPESEALEKILGEAKEAASLSDKLFEALKMGPSPSPVRIECLLEKLRKGLDEETIPVELEADAHGLAAEGHWDADLVVTALLNLLRNGWESQKKRGKGLSLGINVSRDREQGDVCRFTVRDRGHGFSAPMGPDLFDALYSTKQSGSGIGLFIVNQVALAHGGRLSARNHPDGGAEFALDMPLKTE
ncbi:MAG: HAMP domain-containing sensor histidine kinase [bacterium]